MRDSHDAQLIDEHELNSSTEAEDTDTGLSPSTQTTSAPQSSVQTSRRERVRARQALQSGPSQKHVQHKAKKESRTGLKASPVLLGCVVAAALGTACIARWFNRRKLKHKRTNVQHLLTKCKLEPSEAVQAASPPPPLLSTTFVTTAV